MPFCNKCGAENPLGHQFCHRCGNRLSPAGQTPLHRTEFSAPTDLSAKPLEPDTQGHIPMSRCIACGSPVPAGESLCPHCAKRAAERNASSHKTVPPVNGYTDGQPNSCTNGQINTYPNTDKQTGVHPDSHTDSAPKSSAPKSKKLLVPVIAAAVVVVLFIVLISALSSGGMGGGVPQAIIENDIHLNFDAADKVKISHDINRQTKQDRVTVTLTYDNDYCTQTYSEQHLFEYDKSDDQWYRVGGGDITNTFQLKDFRKTYLFERFHNKNGYMDYYYVLYMNENCIDTDRNTITCKYGVECYSKSGRITNSYDSGTEIVLVPEVYLGGSLSLSLYTPSGEVLVWINEEDRVISY